MKVLVDMNLSPSWAAWLAQQGVEAVHWSAIGVATAPDDELLRWAQQHGFVLLTADLDFSAILAASGHDGPSVAIVRAQNLNSTRTMELVSQVLRAHELAIDRGVLLSIDESSARARLLPLRGIPSS